MTDLEFLLAAMWARSRVTERHIAAIVDPAQLKLLTVGTHPRGEPTWATAIVNVIQHFEADKHDSKLGGLCLSTAAPTEMCKGMAKVRGVKTIAYIDDNQKIWLWSPGKAKALWSPPKSGAGNYVNPKDTSRDVDLTTIKDLPALKPNTAEAWWKRIVESRVKLGLQASSAIGALESMPAYASRFMPNDMKWIFSKAPPGPAPKPGWKGKGDDIFLDCALALVGLTWNPALSTSEPWDRSGKSSERFGGNNVGAVLVHENRIIGWGINAAAQNRTFHAETLAIQSYLARHGKSRLPDGVRIYSSLQPCDMCAGFIVTVAKNAVVVAAAQDGTLLTVLDRAEHQRVDGCHERYSKLHFERKDSSDRSIDTVFKEKRGVKKGASTTLLVDQEDLDYRKNKEIKNLGTGKFGQTHQQFIDAIRKRYKDHASKGDSDEKRCVEQCMDVLRFAARRGFATHYGLEHIEFLFADQDERHKQATKRREDEWSNAIGGAVAMVEAAEQENETLRLEQERQVKKEQLRQEKLVSQKLVLALKKEERREPKPKVKQQKIQVPPGSECQKCKQLHGLMPSLISSWHHCKGCNARYCPTCGPKLNKTKGKPTCTHCGGGEVVGSWFY